ncbi:MAG: hypothetical protein MR496_00265 [Eubacterium sp.]|nr:hypothetical protein [Eubacterium sp.]
MSDTNKKLYFYMDESVRPFSEDEYKLTLEDKITMIKFAIENGMELDENSELYRLGKKLGLL